MVGPNLTILTPGLQVYYSQEGYRPNIGKVKRACKMLEAEGYERNDKGVEIRLRLGATDRKGNPHSYVKIKPSPDNPSEYEVFGKFRDVRIALLFLKVMKCKD